MTNVKVIQDQSRSLLWLQRERSENKGAHGPPCKRPMYIGSLRAQTHNIFYSVLCYEENSSG